MQGFEGPRQSPRQDKTHRLRSPPQRPQAQPPLTIPLPSITVASSLRSLFLQQRRRRATWSSQESAARSIKYPPTAHCPVARCLRKSDGATCFCPTVYTGLHHPLQLRVDPVGQAGYRLLIALCPRFSCLQPASPPPRLTAATEEEPHCWPCGTCNGETLEEGNCASGPRIILRKALWNRRITTHSSPSTPVLCPDGCDSRSPYLLTLTRFLHPAPPSFPKSLSLPLSKKGEKKKSPL